MPPVPEPVESSDQVGVDIGLGLLSRWPLIDTETHPLPNRQRGGAPPVALHATVAHPVGPLHILVFCSERQPEYGFDHAEQCRTLAALAMNSRFHGSLPVIVAGDLNASVDQPEVQPLVHNMVDAIGAGGGEPSAVTLDSSISFAPNEAHKQIDRRMDHVFIRSGYPGGSVRATRSFLAGDAPVGWNTSLRPLRGGGRPRAMTAE